MSLSRRNRKDVLIGRNIASDISDTAVGYQQFCKESRKRQKKLCLNELFIFPSLSKVLSLNDVPKTVF